MKSVLGSVVIMLAGIVHGGYEYGYFVPDFDSGNVCIISKKIEMHQDPGWNDGGTLYATVGKTSSNGKTSISFTYQLDGGRKTTVKYNGVLYDGSANFSYKGHDYWICFDWVPLLLQVEIDGDACLQVYIDDKYNVNDTPVIPTAWQKARTLKGAWGEACSDMVEGLCDLKCGKASKKGLAKVSLTITPFSGKKISYKSVSVRIPESGSVTAEWPGKYSVTIEEDGSFSGEPIYSGVRPCCSPDAVWNAEIGGAVTGNHSLKMPNWYEYDGDGDIDGSGGTEEDFLYATGLWQKYHGGACVNSMVNCAEHQFSVIGSKWVFEHYKLSHWNELYYNENVPSVTYNAKTGAIKGYYKITPGPFCMEMGAARFRTKTYKLKLTGAYVNGGFYGVMSYNKFSTPFYGY